MKDSDHAFSSYSDQADTELVIDLCAYKTRFLPEALLLACSNVSCLDVA